MTRGTQAHKRNKWVLLTMREECVARKAGSLPPAQEMAPASSDTHAGAGGRGGRERARGLTRPKGAARMLSRHLSGRGGRPSARRRGEERSRSRP